MGSLPSLGRAVHAGVDYLTVTTRNPVRGAGLFLLADHWWSAAGELHEVDYDAFVRGYRGRQTNRLFVGNRSDGTILRASSDAAEDLALRAIGYADNVSRLDIQVTAQPHEGSPDLAGMAYATIAGGFRTRGRIPTVTLIKTNKGGRTLYVGRRVSDVYLRLYNKSAEEGVREVPARWRYEVELKNAIAKKTAQAIAASKAPNVAINSLVYRHFGVRGMVPVFGRADDPPSCTVDRQPSNLARRLKWLATQVYPVVAACQGHVSDRTLAMILGLNPQPEEGRIGAFDGEEWVETMLAKMMEVRGG